MAVMSHPLDPTTSAAGTVELFAVGRLEYKGSLIAPGGHGAAGHRENSNDHFRSSRRQREHRHDRPRRDGREPGDEHRAQRLSDRGVQPRPGEGRQLRRPHPRQARHPHEVARGVRPRAGAAAADDFARHAGDPVDWTIAQIKPFLQAGDIIIDGGNSYYRDDIRRASEVGANGLHYVDVGTSGGVFGLQRGFCLMIGAEDDIFTHLEPVEDPASFLDEEFDR
jgi:hypothetical protein